MHNPRKFHATGASSVTDSRITRYVRQFKLDDHLNPDLLRCLTLRQFPAGHHLYMQEEEPTSVYLLVEGRVQVNHDHPGGKLAVLAMLTPLAMIGDVEVFSGEVALKNVVTLEPTTLLAIEKSFVRRFGYDDPRFLRLIIQNLTHKLYHSSYVQIGQVLSLAARLANYLLHECDPGGNTLELPPRSHLAALLGTSPRHLNRVLRQFQLENLIMIQHRTLTLLDVTGLTAHTLH